MKTKRSVDWTAIGVALSLLLSLLGSLSGVATAAPIRLRYSDMFPASYPFGELSTEFARELGERTNGRVEVQVFPSGTLTPAPECYEGVVLGLSDICQTVLAYTPGRFPVMEVVDIPGYPHVAELPTLVANEIYRQFQPKEFHDVKVLYLHAHPPGVILTANKPVRTLADLGGLRIRSTGLSARILTALGAAPVSMPITQAYDPLRRGIVDGTDGSLNTHKFYRLAEVTRYTTVATDVGYVSTFVVAMNPAKWNELPDDIKEIVAQVSSEYSEKAAALWRRIETEGFEFAKAQGHEFIYLAPDEVARWRNLVVPVLEDDYIRRTTAAGLPGEAVLELKHRVIEENVGNYPPLIQN